MLLPRDRTRVQRTGSLATSPRSYIEPQPLYRQKSQRLAVVGSCWSCEVPEIHGSRSRRVQATSCWLFSAYDYRLLGHGKTYGGHYQAGAPELLACISPDPQHKGRYPCTGCGWVGKCPEGMTALSTKCQSL